MGLFDKLFGRKKPAAPSTSEVARERLTLMLVHDRLKLTPDLLERIKEELLAVISKYVEIEESGVDVELTHTEHSDKLIARMPVRRQRLPFQRDVLETGMGNPLAAAAALAKIHQTPDEAAPAENAAGAAPAQATDGAPAAAAAPEAEQSSPAAVVPAAPVQEAAAPASAPGEAAPQAVAEPAASAATESVAPADDSKQTTNASQEAPEPPGEASAVPAGEASAVPGDAAEPAAPAAPAVGGAASTETPAPAAAPTKG